MKHTFVVFMLVLSISFLSGIGTTEAATFNSWGTIVGDDDDGGRCDNTDIMVDANVTGTVDDDGFGADFLVSYARDGDGSLIDLDTEVIQVGITDDINVNMQGGNPEPINSSPMYIFLYDVNSAGHVGTETEANIANVQANGTLIATLVVDVRDFIPSCANIPYIAPPGDATPIPSMSTWGLVILAGLLGFAGIRRRITVISA
ncbi:MAG: IPTL-CTERM sorting domain-containing protein [Proteobacteria bacterium]|nr:IPTL-CTERM sorting domain-containing protein [Pseudomonadota bacterium]